MGVSDTKIDTAIKSVFSESAVAAPHLNAIREYSSPSTSAVNVWLQQLLGVFVDKQPDKDEWHCPVAVNRRHLWGMFHEENDQTAVAKHSFYGVLHKNWRWVKFPKNTRLGKCDTCVEIKE